MTLHPSWGDIIIRLVCTVVAAGFIGFDRGVRGHVAGLRTTILVGLAAALAMVEANLLLSVSGKTAASFSMMDQMRWPLGILTGVGFIGAGTILRRGDLVTGVTTAATLWAVTVIGLCFGGGQFFLGGAGSALAIATLSGLRWLDARIPREQRIFVVIVCNAADKATDLRQRIRSVAESLGYRAALQCQHQTQDDLQLHFQISGQKAEIAGPPVDLLDALNRHFEVERFEVATEPHD